MMTTRSAPPAALHPGRVCMSRIHERQAPQRWGPEMADRKANARLRFALALAGVLVVPAIQAEDGQKMGSLRCCMSFPPMPGNRRPGPFRSAHSDSRLDRECTTRRSRIPERAFNGVTDQLAWSGETRAVSESGSRTDSETNDDGWVRLR